MCANSNLEDRVAKLESQNEELNLKIKQLEKFFDDEKFKTIENAFQITPGLLYLDSRLTTRKLDEMIVFVKKNMSNIDKIRSKLVEFSLFGLSLMIKFQMMDLSRRNIGTIFGKSTFHANEKQLHQYHNKCFTFFKYTSEIEKLDPSTLLQELTDFKEDIEHEFDGWK
jgi:hypothetical protein